MKLTQNGDVYSSLKDSLNLNLDSLSPNRKRSNKQKSKNFQNTDIALEPDEIIFNEGDGLIDSDED